MVVKTAKEDIAVKIVAFPETRVRDVSTATTTVHPIKTAEFERRRWPYILTMPISWLLTFWVMIKKTAYRQLGKSEPKINTFWFDRFGLGNRYIKEGAASWKALDIIYNHEFGCKNGNGNLGKWFDDFWIGMMNAQAVRNRLKLVKQLLRDIVAKYPDDKEIKLLSLAAGSAQGIIEMIAELKSKGVKIKALLIDIDSTALAYAKKLAEQNGILDQIELVEKNVAHVAKILKAKSFQPDIIEMLGLIDYLPRDKVIKFAQKIRELLSPGGIFLTCNIHSNLEQHFLKWVINWDMIYRSPQELKDIIAESGFTDYQFITEPLKIHSVIVAHKPE